MGKMVEPFSDGSAVKERLTDAKATLLFFTSNWCRPCDDQKAMMLETSGEPAMLTDIQYRYGKDVQILSLNVSEEPLNQDFLNYLVKERKCDLGTPLNVFYQGTVREDAICGALPKGVLFTKLDRLTGRSCGVGCQIRRLFGNYRHR